MQPLQSTNSIGIINKPFVESAGFLETLESVIIPQMERFRPHSMCIHPSIHSSIQPSHLFILPPIHLISSIHPSNHLSIHLFIHPSIHFINPFFNSFIHLSIHLFIHPPIFSTIYPPIFFIHLFIHGSYLKYVYVYVSSAAGFNGNTCGQLCLVVQPIGRGAVMRNDG